MISIICRLTRDFEVQTTTSGIEYVTLDVAENKGFGETAKTQFHRCTVWGSENVARLEKAKVQKGSFINVVGEQELSAYISKTTGEVIPSSQINVWHWEYVQAGGKKSGNNESASNNNGYNTNVDASYNGVASEICDDDLPI